MRSLHQLKCRAYRILMVVALSLAGASLGVAEEIRAEGTYVHAPSHFSFPTNLGSFLRVSLHKYDQAGKNVSAGYNSTSLPLTVTVYVYPAAKNLAILPQKKDKGIGDLLISKHFTQVTNDIIQARKGTAVKLVQEGACDLAQGKITRKGRNAVFAFSEQFGPSVIPVQSELFLFLLEPDTMFLINDRFYVKFRSTYPASMEDRATTELKKFMDTFVWPTK